MHLLVIGQTRLNLMLGLVEILDGFLLQELLVEIH